MFYDSAYSVFRVAVAAVSSYVLLIVCLRLSGKRTLSKWNAFDLVVTIALGSTLATVILSRETTLAQGLAAFVALIGMQFLITWSSVRFAWARRLLKSEPTLLLSEGRLIQGAMHRQRVTESEVRAAVRAAGHAAVESVYAVVLETDGSFSVIVEAPAGAPTAMADLSSGQRQPT